MKFGSHNNYKCATKKQKLKVVKAGCLKILIVDTFIYMFSAIPTVQVLSPKYPVDYGRTVTLECVVESYPPHTDVTWYRIVNGARNRVVVGNRYSGSTPSSPSLTIKQAEFNDEGYYVCTAENAAGEGSSGQTFVDVSGSMY